MDMTPQGLQKLSRLEADKLVAYRDVGGVWTIGRGWTGYVRGKPITAGVRITQAESDQLFSTGLKPYIAQVNALTQPGTPQRVFEAQVMLAWNIGWAGWKHSSAARFYGSNRLWNKDTIAQLGVLMKQYNKVRKGGKLVVSSGLNNRRAGEVAWMQGSNNAPMTGKQKIAAVMSAPVAVAAVADQTGADTTGTLQSIVDNASIFGMTGSTTLAMIGSVLVIGVVGYIVYSRFAGKTHKAEADDDAGSTWA